MKPDKSAIQLLCINDFHAEIHGSSYAPGSARLVTAVKQFQKEHPDTAVLFGGDNYKGDPISECCKGAPVSAMMRMLDARATVLGNHDFDFGLAELQQWRRESGCALLAANVADAATGAPADFAKPYIMLELVGASIAVIGLALAEPMATSDRPTDMHGFQILDGVSIAQELVHRLKAGVETGSCPDAVIALTHYGLRFAPDGVTPVGDELLRLCSEVPELDGVFAAHFHQFMALYINGVPVVQGGSSGRGFALLELAQTETGMVATPRFVEFGEEKNALVPDAAMAQVVATCRTQAMAELGELVAHLDEDIVHRLPERSELNQEGGPLSDLAVSVMLEQSGCKAALFYAGRMGRGLTAGDISLYQLYQTLNFENGMVTVELTGRDLLRNVEAGLTTLSRESASPLAFGGLNLVADYSKPFGSRIECISFADGSALAPEEYYPVVIDQYLAENPFSFDFTTGRNMTYLTHTVRKCMVEKIKETGRIAATAHNGSVSVKNKLFF